MSKRGKLTKTLNIQRILILFPKFYRTFYTIKLNKWLNNNIQQYVSAEKTVNYQEKKDELPNDTTMVHTTYNVHFSWSLAGVATSRVSIQSHMVSYCTAIKLCSSHFWQKFENSKWPPFLGRGNFFLKIAISTLLRYPVGRKFQRNCSISHG